MTRDECINGLQQIIDQNKSKILVRVHVGYLIHAIKYMKEQEPVMWSYDGYNCFVCSNCGLCIKDEVHYLMDKPISFCPACGRKVKWNDQ